MGLFRYFWLGGFGLVVVSSPTLRKIHFACPSHDQRPPALHIHRSVDEHRVLLTFRGINYGDVPGTVDTDHRLQSQGIQCVGCAVAGVRKVQG